MIPTVVTRDVSEVVIPTTTITEEVIIDGVVHEIDVRPTIVETIEVVTESEVREARVDAIEV